MHVYVYIYILYKNKKKKHCSYNHWVMVCLIKIFHKKKYREDFQIFFQIFISNSSLYHPTAVREPGRI